MSSYKIETDVKDCDVAGWYGHTHTEVPTETQAAGFIEDIKTFTHC